MYTAQLTIDRIKTLIKEKGLTQKMVLSECGINENTLKRMTDNKGMSSFYLAKIADRLGCSVDYLLGRTDNPDIHPNSSESNSPSPISDINKIFNNLSDEDKIRVLYQAVELKNKDKK